MRNEGVPELMLIGSEWTQEPELHLPLLVWHLGGGGQELEPVPSREVSALDPPAVSDGISLALVVLSTGPQNLCRFGGQGRRRRY